MPVRMFGAAALLAILAQASNVNVHNNCNFHIMATPSHEGTDDNPQYIEPGDKFTAPADGSAWCLKLYAAQGDGFAKNPTQLEWSTWQSGGHTLLSYDLSDIDIGDDTSFLQHGMNLTSADPSCYSQQSTCRPAICEAQGTGDEQQPCKDAYNQPYDTRTLGASADYDVNMHLCTANDQTDLPDHKLKAREAEPSLETRIAHMRHARHSVHA